MRITFLVCVLVMLTGCTSSEALQKSADNHTKASEYYKSIGQQAASNEEKKLAKKDNDDSIGIIAILADLINLSSDKN